jgi:hypothetical protein
MSKTLILDARVSSYAGEPTRLVATCDVATGRIYISAEKPFHPPKVEKSLVQQLKAKITRGKTLVITDSADNMDKWDLLYREGEHLTEIVRCYHEKIRNNLLAMDDKVQGRYNPENVLQQRRLDANKGAVWELSTETQNGHICILLACWASMRGANSFMFAHQLHQDDSKLEFEPESSDFDEPFTV